AEARRVSPEPARRWDLRIPPKRALPFGEARCSAHAAGVGAPEPPPARRGQPKTAERADVPSIRGQQEPRATAPPGPRALLHRADAPGRSPQRDGSPDLSNAGLL